LLYGLLNNNSINYIDTLGLDEFKKWKAKVIVSAIVYLLNFNTPDDTFPTENTFPGPDPDPIEIYIPPAGSGVTNATVVAYATASATARECAVNGDGAAKVALASAGLFVAEMVKSFFIVGGRVVGAATGTAVFMVAPVNTELTEGGKCCPPEA